MLQLALPICSFASEVVTVVYKGGTDTDMAPPIDHYHLVSPVTSCDVRLGSGGSENKFCIYTSLLGTRSAIGCRINLCRLYFPAAVRYKCKVMVECIRIPFACQTTVLLANNH
jgi:hypothetical protein